MALAQGASYIGYGESWRLVTQVRNGPRLPLKLVLQETMLSLSASRIFAFGGAGGLSVDYWALRQTGMSTHEAIVRIAAYNIALYAWFGIIAVSSGIVCLLTSGLDFVQWAAAGWIAFVGLLAIAAIITSRPKVTAYIYAHRRTKPQRTLADALEGLLLGWEAQKQRESLRLNLSAAVYWLGDIACLWLAFRSVGVAAAPWIIALGYACTQLTSLLPVLTGAEGGVEATLGFLFHGMGYPLDAALPAAIIFRLFNFWLPTLPAFVMVRYAPRIGRRFAALGNAKQPA